MFGASKFNRLLPHPGYNKKDSDAPDYSALAAASRDAAKVMADLGYGQLDFAKQQYNDLKPLFEKITQSQLDTQAQTSAMAKDYYNYQQNTFRPLEERMVNDAKEFNTGAYRERLAGEAAADAGLAFTNTQAMNSRNMASMGVNPNSGRFSGTANRNSLALAASRAGNMNRTREQSEALGYAKLMDAVGLGRGLTGASQGAYGVALNAGNSAGQNAMAPGNQYLAGAGQAAGIVGQGQQMNINGLSNVLNAQTSVYNADSNSGLDVGGLLSGGAALYSAFS